MLLELEAIQKRFGGVTALRNGNCTVKAGEVHLLMGENGAGKSTLMKIVAGMISPDAGEMRFRGQAVRFRNPAEAAASGIAMVHQESLLAPHLSVAENIFLGREDRHPLGWIKRRDIEERARRLIEHHGFPLKAESLVGKLSPAGKQLVEICRAVQQGSSLLIFDEPTSSLTDSETQEVFRIVQELRLRQVGVIYITHRLEELRAIGDRVTVLRDGATVHSCMLTELTTDQLIQHMVGRPVTSLYRREPFPPGEEMLRVTGLTCAPLLNDVSFTVRAGEIVGMAGLIGAGRTELCRALFGIDAIDSGEVQVAGKTVRIRSPRDAVNAGIALVPEDRQRTGLAIDLPIAPNVTMASLRSVSSMGFLNLRSERLLTTEYGTRLRLKCDGPGQLARRLSGGNQQKVVIAKWLATKARVILFDEPTRGIDVGAKVEVFETMNELAKSGAAILMMSSEMAEIQSVADRILVMRRGRLAGELPRGATQEEILRLAAFEEKGRIVIQRLLPFATLVALFVGLAIASPHFLTGPNLSTVIRQTTVINIMALGMTLIIISGGIDLSVGSILAIGGFVGSAAMKQGYSIPVAIAIGIAAGTMCGLVNGVLITRLKVNPFIVTLGTMGIYRGVVLLISNGLPVHEIPLKFAVLGSGTDWFGIPIVLWILLVCAGAMHIVLEHTRLGRYAFSIGSNPDAAFYAGIPVAFNITSVYAIAGGLTGLSGMIEASRLMSGQPTAGQGYELQAIAAVVIGGGSLRGGEGSVLGTLVGAFIMGLLSDGSDLLGINPYWQQVIIGGVIILAVWLDELRKRRGVS